MQIQETTKIQTIDISDGVLAQQTLAGDPYAFEDLVKRYSTPLFNFIYRFLGDYDQACDILQHVFIQLHGSLTTLRTDKPLKAWLFQVARNRCLDELRRQRRRAAIPFSQDWWEDEDEGVELPESIRDRRRLPDEVLEPLDLRDVVQRAIGGRPRRFLC